MVAGIRFGGLVIILLALAAPATRTADDAAIKKAIERGVASLKQIQREDGAWDDGNPQHLFGATALAGLTLLECDVPAEDPAVRKAAAIIRASSSGLLHTYSISLSILFLDRLGDADDEGIIQMLVVRLLAGQNSAGAWTYNCPGVFTPGEIRRLTTAPRPRAKGDDKRPAPEKKRTDKEPSRELRQLLQAIERQVASGQVGGPGPGLAMGDNSNTQFATLALWVGRRHGLPVDKALDRIEARYRNSQSGDGGWGYMVTPQFTGRNNSTPAMTCAGLLGLAVARGAANEARLRTAPKADSDAQPGKATSPADSAKDPAVEAGLIYLGSIIGGAADAQGSPMPRASGTLPPWVFMPPPPQVGGDAWIPDYYFLWSLERVAMAFSLQTIAKKDWYAWGSQILLPRQRSNGSWVGKYKRGGPGDDVDSVDTCFALLFLRRSNLARDLSTSLKGQVKDPGERTLRSGGVGGEALANRGSKSERADKSRHPKLILGPEKKPRAAAPQEKRSPRPEEEEEPTTPVEADRLSAQLVKAAPERQEALLEKLREGKGAAHTQALAAAIPQLTGATKTKAREALAKRLARMTDATLRDKLQDEDLEIRRAAALACAVKDEKEFVPDLIKLLNDPEPPVHRAAHAALTTLTGKDFGPSADASRAERVQAIDKWNKWWAKQKEK